jgi:hypothetical protein
MKVLFVAGTFDDNGGKPSGYMQKLAEYLREDIMEEDIFCVKAKEFIEYNGGSWEKMLVEVFPKLAKMPDIVFWFADVPNDKVKLVDKIKAVSPKSLLVISKNNMDSKYSIHGLVGKMLKLHANLMLEISGNRSKILASIYDPLGNCFLRNEEDIVTTGLDLMLRIQQIMNYRRVGSECIGEAVEIPNEEVFFNLSKTYASKFHELVHTDNKDRFLGNLSFRCENGFPSFRSGDKIYVSKRNVDKRDIGRDGFVCVDSGMLNQDSMSLKYYGNNKPSVDSPIHVMLYNTYPNLRYIMHSHVYIAGIPTTKEVIPCGCTEEAYVISDMVGKKLRDFCMVNLNGHGSIVLASDVKYLEDIKYVAREIPTIQY